MAGKPASLSLITYLLLPIDAFSLTYQYHYAYLLISIRQLLPVSSFLIWAVKMLVLYSNLTISN